MRYMAERHTDFDPAVWNQWEKTSAGKAVAMAGIVDAIAAMRAAGVTVIVNTNSTAANAKGTADTPRAAGLGEFRQGETLCRTERRRVGTEGGSPGRAQKTHN